MRKKLWLSSLTVTGAAVLIVGVPALVIASGRGAAAVAVIGGLMVVATGLAGWLTAVLAAADAAGRRARRGGRAARGRRPAPAGPPVR